ncbi:MAG TPA: hypothetical protein VMO17_01205 [Terriglobia bacterium]|nr:hypothetical protein [Terriglobia bacterium]
MPRSLFPFLVLLLYFIPCALPAAAGELRAGAAKSVITPEVHAARVYISGYGQNRVATGVHDDLYARCLALSAADQTLVVCAADLIGLFYDDVLKIREMVKVQAPEVTHLIVASTHDHEGPDTMGLWGPGPLQSGIDEKYMAWLRERIAQTALEAARSMRPARLTLGRDDHPLLALLQSDSRPPYVKDPYLFVMHLASASDGEAIANLINWSDHPETLGEKNTEITADYPHWLCDYAETHLGGTAIFLNGSIGGLLSTNGNSVALQDPESGKVAADDTWRKAELFGITLGQLAERAVQGGEEVNVDSMVFRGTTIFSPLHNDHFRAALAAGVLGGRKPLFTNGVLDPTVVEKEVPGLGKLKFSAGGDVQTEVNYIRLQHGPGVVAEIVTIPGEIYPELVNGGITRYPGADFPDAPFEPIIRPHLKSKYQFVFGLADDELGYIIPKSEYDDQPPWLLNTPDRWYGEVNSAGPDIAGAVTRSLVGLIDGRQ